jgi:hypothetical protein
MPGEAGAEGFLGGALLQEEMYHVAVVVRGRRCVAHKKQEQGVRGGVCGV